MDCRAHSELRPVAANQDIRIQSHRLVAGTQKGTPVHSEGVNVPVSPAEVAQRIVRGRKAGEAEPVANSERETPEVARSGVDRCRTVKSRNKIPTAIRYQPKPSKVWDWT